MILVSMALAIAPAAETPKAFLDRVYASYRDRNFSPFEHADSYFAPKLKAAIEEDSRLAKGEVGYVDGDPICQCQDSEGLRAKVLRIRFQGPRKAIAKVLPDYPDSTATYVKLSLVKTEAGWRISDVSSGDEPSLLRAIEASNRNAQRRR